MSASYGPPILRTPAHGPSSPPVTPDSGGPQPQIRPLRAFREEKPSGGVYASIEFSPPLEHDISRPNRLHTATPELLSVPRSRSQQSRASSAVSGSPGPRSRRSTPDVESVSEVSDTRSSLRRGDVDDADELVVEEIPDNESTSMSRSRIVYPDSVEDADSVRAESPSCRERSDMIKKFQELHHGEEDSKDAVNRDIEKWNRKSERRWSKLSKRTFSMSRGSDPDDEDTRDSLDFDEAGSSARRVRRRTGGIRPQTSLLFDDPPVGHITEVDEFSDEACLIDAPPMYDVVDWTAQLQYMPYYKMRDPMALDDDIEDEEKNVVGTM